MIPSACARGDTLLTRTVAPRRGDHGRGRRSLFGTRHADMAFHFPSCAQFMALRREEAKPISRSSTALADSDGAQGPVPPHPRRADARMVTDEERDYCTRVRHRPAMKLNLVIRRRLAPLLDGGRDEIDLMHAILSRSHVRRSHYGERSEWVTTSTLSRDGVARRCTGLRPNAGFSPRDFALRTAAAMDPVFCYPSVNVEAAALSHALLLWMPSHRAAQGPPVFGVAIRGRCPRTRAISATCAATRGRRPRVHI